MQIAVFSSLLDCNSVFFTNFNFSILKALELFPKENKIHLQVINSIRHQHFRGFRELTHLMDLTELKIFYQLVFFFTDSFIEKLKSSNNVLRRIFSIDSEQ